MVSRYCSGENQLSIYESCWGAGNMANAHSIIRLAATGGLTAAVALLTGLPLAGADELADLRANQELLQRRIDQLAQAQAPGGGGPPAPLTGGAGGGAPATLGTAPR